VAKTLAEDKFDFTGHDKYAFDREKSPRPSDAAEARQLWRQHLKAEYLQEKLAGKKPEQITQTLSRRYARQDQMMKEAQPGLCDGDVPECARAYLRPAF